MMNKKIPYLCGGTLFFLLVQAKKSRTKAREREKGISDGLQDPAMMEGLIQAITGNSSYAYFESFKKSTSQFRECRTDGGMYIPFHNSATASGYDYDITNRYTSVLLRMNKFVEDFLDPAKATWLVRVLLDVIDQDTGISDDDHFYIHSDGTSLSKSDMLSEVRFELQPFLVGVVHYILTNRRDNLAGKDTLENWGTKAGARSERKLKSDFSLGNSRTATVIWYRPDTANVSEDRDEPEPTSEYTKAEVVEEHTDASKQDENRTMNQSVFINNGSGIQIGINYGTIDLAHRKENDKD